MASTLSSTPFTPSPMPKNWRAGPRDVSTRFESNSNMPISNMPTTLNFFWRGIIPRGPVPPVGETILTVSPGRRDSRIESSLPMIMPGSSPSSSLRSRSEPICMCFSMSVVSISKLGFTPLM